MRQGGGMPPNPPSRQPANLPCLPALRTPHTTKDVAQPSWRQSRHYRRKSGCGDTPAARSVLAKGDGEAVDGAGPGPRARTNGDDDPAAAPAPEVPEIRTEGLAAADRANGDNDSDADADGNADDGGSTPFTLGDRRPPATALTPPNKRPTSPGPGAPAAFFRSDHDATGRPGAGDALPVIVVRSAASAGAPSGEPPTADAAAAADFFHRR
eukprot:TRINITY_DN58110_c0_g1_i1.p1 TRINITY_DN58110_c0_g1~~TRINITY_DN58110_c0_g1_i1.p1  ORF type:complete len:211 (+),score=28.85 TRINITY_DN58110_c0_g1_i1:325-957(+)